eukprot:s2077_g2.t1
MIVSSAYALALLASVGIPLGGIVLARKNLSSDAGLCPPCECSTVAPTLLLLERCVIPIGYVAQGARDVLDFNLTNRNITEVLPDALIARGPHQEVRSVSLRGNRLTQLPEGLFRDLLQQFRIETIDLADNSIAALPRTVFQSGRPGDLTKIRELHLEGNCLTTLPAGVFHGLTFGDYGILDMSRNKLQDLPPKVFPWQLDKLEILDLAYNELSRLPDEIFYRLEWLRRLRLEGNRLRSLGNRPFYRNLSSLKLLNLSQNALAELPPGLFDGQNLSVIDLSHNNLTKLDPKLFDLENLTTLDLRGNRLTDATRRDLAGLKVELYVD